MSLKTCCLLFYTFFFFKKKIVMVKIYSTSLNVIFFSTFSSSIYPNFLNQTFQFKGKHELQYFLNFQLPISNKQDYIKRIQRTIYERVYSIYEQTVHEQYKYNSLFYHVQSRDQICSNQFVYMGKRKQMKKMIFHMSLFLTSTP